MDMSPTQAGPSRFLLLAALGAMLSGCQTVQERRLLVTPAALKAGRAIAIISTSADEPCRFNANYLEVVDQRRIYGAATMQLDTASAPSDFSDRFGFFDAFVLEPGDYWLRLQSFNVSRHFRDANVAAFHLEPGEIRYVGNVHVGGCRDLLVRVGEEWSSVRAALPGRFPGLDVDAVAVPAMVRGAAFAGGPITSPPAPLSLREPFLDAGAIRPPGEGEAPSTADSPPVVPPPSPPPIRGVSSTAAAPKPLSTQQRPAASPGSFHFLSLDPVRFIFGLSSGASWLRPSSADPQGIGRVGPNFYVDVGLTFCDVASVSASFGAMFPSDRGSFTQTVVGDGAPFSASSTLQITNYSFALGPRTPLLVLSPDANSVWAAALFADYGWSRIAGNRNIESCVDCRKEDFDLPGGNFMRIGANIGKVAVSAPRPGLVLTIAYQRYLSGAAMAQELRAGFSFWL